MGNHAEAAAAFAAAFAEAPDFADAAQNLGCCQAALGDYEEAARTYAAVVQLRPHDPGSHFNVGCTLLAAGSPLEAIAALREAVRLAPGQAKHHHILGQALVAADRKAEALEVVRTAARLDRNDPAILACFAALLTDDGQYEAAAIAGSAAVVADPGNGHAQGNLARALLGTGRAEAALEPALASARLLPDDAGVAATLAAIHYMLGQYEPALEQSRAALRLDPALFQAKANESLALEATGRLEDAEAAGWQAIEVAPPGNAEIRHNLACMLLRSGRMTAEAWALYDSRLYLNEEAQHLAATPRWVDQDVAGRTVLLHCEQGFGDTIQFARYAPLVKARGAKVLLAVQPALHRLLRDVPGTDGVVPAAGTLPAHDVFCPLLSLPGIFGTTLETIPPLIPIVPDPALVERWHPPAAPGLLVGLVWAGNAVFVHDRTRSVGLAHMAVLADVPGVTFYSLQMPHGRGGDFPMVDLMAGVTDFADTAAIIAGLDLVITVDSAVAHLAASMGRPVWLLSRFLGCWRWLRERTDSPWYPTMRIYRQPRPGDWVSVMARVRDDLLAHPGLHDGG